MKKYLNNTIWFSVLLYFFYSVAQDIAISGACFDGIQTLVLRGDQLCLYNGKPVYYNAAASQKAIEATCDCRGLFILSVSFRHRDNRR
jgi:hypothetical protein